MKTNILSLLLAVATLSPRGVGSKQDSVNQLTGAEKAAGWRMLFDGKTFDGWRGFTAIKSPPAGQSKRAASKSSGPGRVGPGGRRFDHP